MQPRRNTGHPPGTIITAAGIQPRYYEFTESLDKLQVPEGTIHLLRRSCDVCMNFNRGTREMTGDWIWYLGDDHAFPPDLLFKFLDYHVDVVVPISPCKTAPFMPCVIHGPTDGTIWDDDMPLYTWEELSGDGLLPLPKGDFIGQAGMLVKKHVLDAIGDPWFKAGKIDPGRLAEDLWFCHELQEKGFTVHVDQTTIFDHWFPQGITARKFEGKWVPAIKSGAMTMVLPDAANAVKGLGNTPKPEPVETLA
jgi:hypothetical protein